MHRTCDKQIQGYITGIHTVQALKNNIFEVI
jgi:hypothetical protein